MIIMESLFSCQKTGERIDALCVSRWNFTQQYHRNLEHSHYIRIECNSFQGCQMTTAATPPFELHHTGEAVEPEMLQRKRAHTLNNISLITHPDTWPAATRPPRPTFKSLRRVSRQRL